jgi:hypothetical protein
MSVATPGYEDSRYLQNLSTKSVNGGEYKMSGNTIFFSWGDDEINVLQVGLPQTTQTRVVKFGSHRGHSSCRLGKLVRIRI